MRRGRSQVLLVLLALTLCLAGLAACGDEDSASTSAEAQREAQTKADAEVRAHNAEVMKEYRERRAAEKPTEEEVEAQETASDFYAILGEDSGGAKRTTIDSSSFCDLMSERAVAQTVEYARVSSGIAQEWDCERTVAFLVIRSKRSGGFKGVKQAKVIGVNAEGDRATATVRFGNGPLTSIPLVKEDGEWKLAASPAGDNR